MQIVMVQQEHGQKRIMAEHQHVLDQLGLYRTVQPVQQQTLELVVTVETSQADHRLGYVIMVLSEDKVLQRAELGATGVATVDN